MQKSEVKLKQINRMLFIFQNHLFHKFNLITKNTESKSMVTIKDDHGVEYAGFVHVPQDFAPNNFRICSKESQKVMDHGAILSQHGKNPL